jgi:hypothetical protein
MITEKPVDKDKRKELAKYLKVKLYPIPYVNSKGYRIGSYHVKIDKKKLPFSHTDEVDHFLYNLYDYVKNESLPDYKDGKPNSNKRKKEEFYKNYSKEFVSFIPIEYGTESEKTNRKKLSEEESEKKIVMAEQEDREAARNFGGKKSRNYNRKTNGKKTKKNRTRKNH